MLCLLIAGTIVELYGSKQLVAIFCGVIVASSLVAILQSLGIHQAYDLRGLLARIQSYDLGYGTAADRAMGFSLSKVILGTQLCLAFAAYYIYREQEFGRPRRLDLHLLAAGVFALAVCVACGNRSPIIGILAFYVIYGARKIGPVALILGLLLLACLPAVELLIEHLQHSGIRAANVDDKSSSGRLPLAIYGFELFAHNLLGYGFNFDPTAHWSAYYHYIQQYKNANAVKTIPLHNYVLNILNVYGVGTFIVAPIALAVVAQKRWYLLGFAPYLGHILFHNEGVMYTDYLIWFIIPVASIKLVQPPMSRGRLPLDRQFGGSRAYRPAPALRVRSRPLHVRGAGELSARD